MPGLTTFLAERLGLEILIADPFLSFLRDKNFPQPLLQVASRFATCVGLSIREL
jgi:Tfp pilus assembly PilM family ATPase